MIQMFSVSKTYPSQITALSDFYLEVGIGEFVFITGPSRSGKSSLLRILFGAEKPTSGEVIVNGIRLTQPGFKKVYQLRRTMGIISPDFKLLRDRNVRENVAFALEVMGHPPKEIQEKVSETLRQMGLQEREKDSILSLSAGEQQRVAIARALVKDPSLILADEPTSLLDDEMTEKVMEIFSELHQKGTTIVFATQDTNLIQRHPHRVISLAAAREGDAESSEEVRSAGCSLF
jgi:cell division transport system ATP-binding protein